MPVSTPGVSPTFLCHTSLTLSTCCRGQSQPSARPMWPGPASLSGPRPLSAAGTDAPGPLSHGSVPSAHPRAQRATPVGEAFPLTLPQVDPFVLHVAHALRSSQSATRLCLCPFLRFVRRSVPGPRSPGPEQTLSKCCLAGAAGAKRLLDRAESSGNRSLFANRRESASPGAHPLPCGRQGGHRLCGEPSSGPVPPKRFWRRCWSSAGHF